MLSMSMKHTLSNETPKNSSSPSSSHQPKAYLSAPKSKKNSKACRLKTPMNYSKAMELHESGLQQMIHAAYDTLGLQSYLTAGEKEVRPGQLKKVRLPRKPLASSIAILNKVLLPPQLLIMTTSCGWLRASRQSCWQDAHRRQRLRYATWRRCRISL